MLEGNPSRIDPKLRARAARVLATLNMAGSPLDLAIPGYRLHELKGAHEGTWSVSVNKNWRITFRFEGPNACDVDLIDHH